MAVRIFYSYSHTDEDLRIRLENHLAGLKRSGWITEWHDRRIDAGSEWRGEIDSNLRSAEIVLLLVSSDFLASDYCFDTELKIAMERHERGEAVVIPVILRPVDWAGTSFAKLQALPKDGRPITSWTNQDEAFANVAAEIRRLIGTRFRPAAATEPGPPAVAAADLTETRVLDAGMPKRIAIGQTAELLAMIRSGESPGLRGVLQVEEASMAPEDVRSRSFELEFPLDVSGRRMPALVTLRIDSPDFEPRNQEKRLRVPPRGDSEVCRFLLTPRRVGELVVMVEVLIEDVYSTSAAFRVSAQDEQRTPSPGGFTLLSFPLFTLSGTAPRPPARGTAPPTPAGAGGKPSRAEITQTAPAQAEPAEPGEFTRIFGKGNPPAPAPPPTAFEAPAGGKTSSPQRTGPGEYTRMYGAPPAAQTASPPVPPAPPPPQSMQPAPRLPTASSPAAPARARWIVFFAILACAAVFLVVFFALRR